MSEVLAVIPARYGSKRLPGKNIKQLAGKPMIAWTILAAQQTGIFSDIVVSTDSEKIAEISQQYGGTVPFLRDAADADDYTPVSIVTVNTLERMGNKYDTVIQLMANCPCRIAQDIKNAYDNFLSSGSEFQISVFKFGWMNPWWAMKVNAGGEHEPLFPKAYKKRSQDLAELYCPSGAIWIANAAALKREKTFYGNGYKVFALSWQSAVDIDDAEDFSLAEMIHEWRKNRVKK